MRAKYGSMTESQLRRQCKDSWVDETGTKRQMIQRLVEYEEPSGGWGGGGSGGRKKSPKSSSDGGLDLWGDWEDTGSISGKKSPKKLSTTQQRARKKSERQMRQKLEDKSRVELAKLCRKNGCVSR